MTSPVVRWLSRVGLVYGNKLTVRVIIEPQQSLRDPRLDVWFLVKFNNQPFRNLAAINVDLVLDRDIDLRASRTDVTGQPGMAFERLPQRI